MNRTKKLIRRQLLSQMLKLLFLLWPQRVCQTRLLYNPWTLLMIKLRMITTSNRLKMATLSKMIYKRILMKPSKSVKTFWISIKKKNKLRMMNLQITILIKKVFVLRHHRMRIKRSIAISRLPALMTKAMELNLWFRNCQALKLKLFKRRKKLRRLLLLLSLSSTGKQPNVLNSRHSSSLNLIMFS